MAYRAGRKITTADLAWKSQMGTLPDDHAQAVSNVLENWGDPVIITNPATAVTVDANAVGYSFEATNASANTGIRIRISFDGGSTWDDGTDPRGQIGSAADSSRGILAALHSRSGTPTADIHVRVQHSSDRTTTRFWRGRVTVLMLPTG